MKYKVGDEVLVKGKIIDVDEEDKKLPFKIKMGDYTSWMAKEDITKTYEEGLNDAWELAKKLVLNKYDNGISNDEIGKIFKMPSYQVFQHMTPQEALAKIEEYEKCNIKVGDVVKVINGYEFVVTLIADGTHLFGITKKGDTYTAIHKSKVKKTGRTIDIESILAEIEKE